MGCSTFVSCPECKVTHDCGHGSYGTHAERAELFLKVHKYCEGVKDWSDDYTYYRGADLMLDNVCGDESIFIEGEKHFRRPLITRYRDHAIIDWELAKVIGELNDHTPIAGVIDVLRKFIDAWREEHGATRTNL